MAEQATFEHQTAIATEHYSLVDDNPWMAYARQQVRDEASQLLELRRRDINDGIEPEHLQVDALSTAHEVLQAKAIYGDQSEEHHQRYSALVLDCQRLIGEWYRKNTSEYFAPTRHVFDADKQEFFSHGLSIRQMTENALMPISDNAEEEARRINERVEEATPQIVRSIGRVALGDTRIRTISGCTDKAIIDYTYDLAKGNPHRGYNGYVPEIQKQMFRDIVLDTETNDRFEEQIGIPGLYITHDIIKMTLAQRGARVDHMDKTALHGAQLLANDTLLDFVAALDETASEQWCAPIFMGEQVSANTPKDYERFKQEALMRQEKLRSHAETVTEFVLDLAETDFDRSKAPAHVENFVKKVLLDIARQEPEVAEQMFDKTTSIGLQEVSQLESQGRFEEALIKLNEVEKLAPGGGFCGAGSCGLESLSITSKDEEKLREKLGADESDVLVKDKERACKCGSKSIVYAFNSKKVIKYCESCNSYEKTFKKAA